MPSTVNRHRQDVEALSAGVHTGIGHTRAMAGEEPAEGDQSASELLPSEPEQGHSFSDLDLRVHEIHGKNARS